MKKDDVLEHIRAARVAHIKWLQKAKMLINGLEVNEDAIPIDSTECAFGKWFYSDGQMLSGLSNNPLECMKQIETLHFNLHDMYLKIFTIYFAEDKKAGFFAKLFGVKRIEPSEVEQKQAQEYYATMAEISETLLDEINRLERRITAISDERIEAL